MNSMSRPTTRQLAAANQPLSKREATRVKIMGAALFGAASLLFGLSITNTGLYWLEGGRDAKAVLDAKATDIATARKALARERQAFEAERAKKTDAVKAQQRVLVYPYGTVQLQSINDDDVKEVVAFYPDAPSCEAAKEDAMEQNAALVAAAVRDGFYGHRKFKQFACSRLPVVRR